MAAKKAVVTRTLNPLHFEDLDPHRFEDLVRRLLYQFRDWTDIEPTGRAGSDEGFDARAFERHETITNVGDEGEEGARTVRGRLWQVQVKRERTITPAKMKTLIEGGVDGGNPPHGYILAAAANISKAACDVFRAELRKKGVKESYFWGKDHLEDQLSLPQNDDILFTFFGISLGPRRRTRTAEIKFAINNKNRLVKLALNGNLHNEGAVDGGRAFLLRDIKDMHYPMKEEYPDFEENRRWEEHDAIRVTATGVVFKRREWYAYCDVAKKEWDFTRAVDLTLRKHNLDTANEMRLQDGGKRVERYWRHLPRRVQAKLVVYGFVPYEDILVIDEKGDPQYPDPHLFIDFGEDGPFEFSFSDMIQRHVGNHHTEFTKFKRCKRFPSSFPDTPQSPKIHEWESLGLNTRGSLTYWVLYSFDGKLRMLEEGDVIRFQDTRPHDRWYLEVTHLYDSTVAAEMTARGSATCREAMTESAGREILDEDRVTVLEVTKVRLPLQVGGPLVYVDASW